MANPVDGLAGFVRSPPRIVQPSQPVFGAPALSVFASLGLSRLAARRARGGAASGSRSPIQNRRHRRQAGDRRSPARQPKRRCNARLFRRRPDAGHHQRARPVFLAHRDVLERRAALQGQAGKSGRNRPQSCGALSGRGQCPSNRRPRARERAARRRQRAGAVVGEFRRGAGGSLCPARQDHDANCRGSGDSRFAGRATARVRQANRKS